MSLTNKTADPSGEAALREALASLPLGRSTNAALDVRLAELLSGRGLAPPQEFWPEILRSSLRTEMLLMRVCDLLEAQKPPTRRSSKG